MARIMPIYMDLPGRDRMGIPELPNWGLPYQGGGGMGLGANLRKFKPNAGSDLGPFQAGGNSADSMLREIFRQSTEGTTRSFDTAANRLRERVDAAGQSKKATASQGMRGLGGRSGFSNRRSEEIDQDSLFSYGQGLSALEAEFENSRQQGLQTALGAGRSIQDFDQSLNQINQQDFGQRRGAMNDASIANSQIGFNRANAMDSLFGEDRRASRANSLQMLLEQMRDRRERDISRDSNETQLKLGKRGDLAKILAMLEGL